MSPVSVEEAVERAKKVKLVIIDVHGVMTDETVWYSEDGSIRLRPFSHRDGLGTYMLDWGGIETAWLTRVSKTAQLRAKELKIKRYIENPRKIEALEQLEQELGLADEEIGYIGDDYIDLLVMKRVGFVAAPADAVEEVKEAAHYVTAVSSGKGVVREVARFILKAQGKWEAIQQRVMEMGY